MVVLLLLAVSLSFSGIFIERQGRLATDGDMRGALEASQLAARLDPFDSDPLQAQSFLLQQQGKNEAAAAALREAIERDPNYYLPYLLLGNLQLFDLEDYADAAESYRDTLRLNPEASIAAAYLARALVREGDLEAAKAEYKRIEEDGTILYQDLYDLGRIEARTGEAQEGVNDIRRAQRQARGELAGLEGPVRAQQLALVRSMDLALADALVVAGRYGQARQILASSPSEQAPALLQLLEQDPAAYREQVINSDLL